MPSFQQHYDPSMNGNSLVRSSSAHLVNKNPFVPSYQKPQFTHHNSFPSNSNIPNPINRRSSLAKLNDFRKKVHEVIDLCTNENTDAKTDLSQVISEERKIYQALQENQNLLRRTVSQQSFPQMPNYVQQQNVPYNQKQLTTPLGVKKQQKIPQSQYYIQSGSQVQNNPYFNPNQVGPSVTNFNSSDNLQNSFLRLKSISQIQLNPDLLQLIEEVERKAYQEIQKLRKQKLEIMQKLNHQIKNLNEEKKTNIRLQNALAIQSSKTPDGFGGKSQHSSQNVNAQISRLQEELNRVNQINHNLRLELSNQGSGVPGIEELLRQGEAIRQETIRLIRIKEQGHSDGGNSKVQELQRRLHAEQAEKLALLNEFKALKDKMGVSQVRTYEEIKLNEKSGIRSKVSLPSKTVGQYEDLVSQMKRITGF